MDPTIACIQPTAYGGRGVFASKPLLKDTLILASAPYASVVYRSHRKEVCVECLAYAFEANRHTWNIKHELAGVWFCSEGCKNTWLARHGDRNIEEAVHRTVKRLSHMKHPKSAEEVKPTLLMAMHTQQSIDDAWNRPMKVSTSLSELELDTVRFVISGIVGRHRRPDTWTDLLELQDNELAYFSVYPAGLAESLRIVAFVCMALKDVTFSFDVVIMARQILSREQANCFGMYEMGGDAEIFGFAIYASGSYFNHDCTPNIRKQRRGRFMEFYADRDILVGEEICISYVDIKDTVVQRQAELFDGWYFRCTCNKCQWESDSATKHSLISV